jgi:alpha-D-xyloside xylohydrolase
VLDWFYWPEDAWGSHAFDLERFPDAAGMVKAVHDLDAQIMISVWPKFYPTTDHYKELDAGGHIYPRQIEMKSRDWVGPGYANSFYDPYSQEGRNIYWRQIEETLGKLGFDAWWMDATEPDLHSNLSYAERALRMGPTALGPGAEFFNSYVLMNSRAIFEGERQARPNTRSFLLTRSAWGGIQRYASAVWSGDVTGRWEDLALQVPAGLNMSLSGVPNWTHDIGGFAVEDRYTQQDPEHLGEWRELYSRWFQFGAFTPIFRSHGEFPFRETWNIAPEGSEVYDGLVYYHKLRYRLLPYIYTLAADTYHRDGTIMRALVMDFPSDENTHDIGDQYMFGPAFHVAPVTTYGARSRDLYLPAGAEWYDFYSGEKRTGGSTFTVDAPLTQIPLHVRAGSIVPMGPDVQYALQETDGRLTIRVYRGADGNFSLYEDDGLTYAAERGEFSRISFRYSEADATLDIAAREGAYPGMHAERTLDIEWIGGPAPATTSVTYSGSGLTVKAPS